MKPRKAPPKSVQAYYQTLKDFEFQRAFHEGAVSVAFQTLLADTARSHGWTLIPQLSDKRAAGGIRPDGTLKDQMNLVRGHWQIVVRPKYHQGVRRCRPQSKGSRRSVNTLIAGAYVHKRVRTDFANICRMGTSDVEIGLSIGSK